MSDGAISQDEIDALLSGMKVDSLGGGGSSSGGLSIVAPGLTVKSRLQVLQTD